jgi:hypothetical protein
MLYQEYFQCLFDKYINFFKKKSKTKPDVVAHTYNPSTWELKQEDCEFGVSVGLTLFQQK